MIRSVFVYLLAVLTYIVGSTIALVISIFVKNKHRPFQIAARLWSKFLASISGIKITVSGLENIDKDKPYIIAANHQGAVDIILALAYLPVFFRFAIKKELFKIPIFGWYLKKAGYFSVDRKIILSTFKLIQTIKDITKDGDSVLIFPEGTRSKTGELGEFKRGSLLAAKGTIPVVPVAISGSFNIMPRGTWYIHKHPIKLSIAKPININLEDDYSAKVKQVHDTIASML